VILTVLGCSGSGPGPASPASGYLVTAGDTHVVLDLGNGALGALHRHLDPARLSAVALTHLHVDHCADVPSLAVHRRHGRPRTRGRLPVHAPVDAPARLAAAYAASPREHPDLSDTFAFHPHTGDPVAIGELTLRAAPVDHPVEAYALRVEHAGASLVYSGDTGPCAGLVELARGADVLLCEASRPHVPPLPPGLHLSGRQAGEHAAAAGVGRLVVTHVPPWHDPAALAAEARAVFDGPVEVATAGLRLAW
jgi:ribonuclease BN (tRNA processing enzyme)